MCCGDSRNCFKGQVRIFLTSLCVFITADPRLSQPVLLPHMSSNGPGWPASPERASVKAHALMPLLACDYVLLLLAYERMHAEHPITSHLVSAELLVYAHAEVESELAPKETYM